MLSKLTDLLNAANKTTLLGMMIVVFCLTVWVLIHFIPRRDEKKAKAAIAITLILGVAIIMIAFSSFRSSTGPTITGDCNATANGNGNQVSSHCLQPNGDVK